MQILLSFHFILRLVSFSLQQLALFSRRGRGLIAQPTLQSGGRLLPKKQKSILDIWSAQEQNFLTSLPYVWWEHSAHSYVAVPRLTGSTILKFLIEPFSSLLSHSFFCCESFNVNQWFFTSKLDFVLSKQLLSVAKWLSESEWVVSYTFSRLADLLFMLKFFTGHIFTFPRKCIILPLFW